MHYIGLRHSLNWISGSAPGRQAAHDHKRVESFPAQQMRHACACSFVSAGAVKIYVLVSRESSNFGAQIVGLNSNRAGNAHSPRTVVTMAAHICYQYLSRA